MTPKVFTIPPHRAFADAPRHGALAELSDEIGNDWIVTYDGDLTAAILVRALERSISMRGKVAPLESLEWPLIARQTRDIYRSLIG